MHVLARRPGHANEPKLFLSRVDLRKMELSDAGLSDTPGLQDHSVGLIRAVRHEARGNAFASVPAGAKLAGA